MSNVVNLREWKMEDGRMVFYKAGKPAGAFGFLDTVDQFGNNEYEILSFDKLLNPSDVKTTFKNFIENMDDNVLDKALHKNCRGCSNIFHHTDLDEEYGVCKKCQRKVDGFKKAINISDMGDSIVGGFGGGRFISSYDADDRLEIGAFKCSLVRVMATCDGQFTLKTLFSDKPQLGKIEKNSENMFTAVYNRQGHPPLPDGLILLFYDIFLNLTNGDIDILENEDQLNQN